MIKDITTIKIGAVWNGGRGATYKDEIKATPAFSPALDLTSPLTAEIMLIRMKEGVSVVLSELHTSLQQQCARCLDEFNISLDIPKMEAHFYDTLSARHQDQTEQFPIRMKDMSIDLTEAIRQEIILHFPMIPVCSNSCKGLCASCKVNLNHGKHRKDCSYDEEQAVISTEEGQTRPFANLKDLFKN